MRRTWPDHWMAIAKECMKMSTCIRREVGCVLVDTSNHAVSMGHNGVPPRFHHCDPNKSTYSDGSDVRTCEGAASAPPGLTDSPVQGVRCMANHAEKNALAHCDRSKIEVCYSTLSPCFDCLKELLCTSATIVVYDEEYPGCNELGKIWTGAVYVSPDRSDYRMRQWIKYSPGLKLNHRI